MKSSDYKIVREFRSEFRAYMSKQEVRDYCAVKSRYFEEAFKEMSDKKAGVKQLDRRTFTKLKRTCSKDQSPTSRDKLNNVLGRKNHLFHIVFPSIWPFMTSLAALFLLSSFLFYFNGMEGAGKHMFIAIILLLGTVISWFRVIIDEATFKGHHTLVVRRGLKAGFYFFIASEVMLFFGLFWAFFHFALSPDAQVFFYIPAPGIKNVSYVGVPMFNTSLLICSSLSLTWAHKGLVKSSFRETIDGLLITILLGLTFLVLQVNEYKSCMFNISDGAYPSSFYMLTGLHGCHVLVGLIWLILNLYRLLDRQFTTKHYTGFLFSIWYWHFVDIIWVGVYCAVYLWLANSPLLFFFLKVVLAFVILRKIMK